jgi:hypothetical protein
MYFIAKLDGDYKSELAFLIFILHYLWKTTALEYE